MSIIEAIRYLQLVETAPELSSYEELKLRSSLLTHSQLDGECWRWIGSVVKGNYGQITFISRVYKVHRLVYEYFVKPIPENLMVLHSCDNPRCFNPIHLEIGDHQDNMDDMAEKSRRAIGIRHGMSVMTEDQVREIRKDKRTSYELAEIYSVNPSTIQRIKNRRYYSTLL